MSLGVPLTVRLKTASADVHVAPRRISYSSGVSGGFRACTIELDRSLAVSHDEIAQFGNLIVYDGRNARVAWQGRLEDPGRGAGADGEIWTLTAVGPAGHARERTVPLIYVDTSLERWFPEGGATRAVDFIQRGQDGPTLGCGLGLGENVADTFDGYWLYTAIREAAMKLARVSADWDSSVTDTDYIVRLKTDVNANVESNTWNTAGGNLDGTKPADWAASAPVDAYLGILANGVNPVAVPTSNYRVVFSNVVVRALLKTAAGADITTGYTVDYVLAHEIVNDLLGRLLNKFDGANASVATNSFQIDQFAFPDGVTPADVLDELVAIHPDHYWAAWEGDPARFEWSAWPTTVRYDATTKDGFESPGSGSDIYNAVQVRWRSPAGKIRVNRRTQTVAVLTSAGLTREALLDLGDEVSSSALADRIGDQFLAEHAVAPNRGVLTVRSAIQDLTWGRTVEPWEILPGTLIRVRDVLPNVGPLNATARDAVTVFRVIGVDYDSDQNTARLELDATSHRLERMLARRRLRRRR